MHDTYLLNKISQSMQEICEKGNIKQVREFTLIVSLGSHVNEENLREHLLLHNSQLVEENLKIKIQREDIEEQTAIIYSLQGETFGT